MTNLLISWENNQQISCSCSIWISSWLGSTAVKLLHCCMLCLLVPHWHSSCINVCVSESEKGERDCMRVCVTDDDSAWEREERRAKSGNLMKSYIWIIILQNLLNSTHDHLLYRCISFTFPCHLLPRFPQSSPVLNTFHSPPLLCVYILIFTRTFSSRTNFFPLANCS